MSKLITGSFYWLLQDTVYYVLYLFFVINSERPNYKSDNRLKFMRSNATKEEVTSDQMEAAD